MKNWNPPEDWQKITTIDAHTAGEPLRIITGEFPEIPGDTILAKRAYAKQHFDHLRTALMWEPRGHNDMYGAIFTEPVTADGDVGVLFIHNEGFSTMCGHGIIGMVKVGIDTGHFPVTGDQTVIRIDTPAGRVTATAHVRDNRCERVSFLNVPSFLLDEFEVDVPSMGHRVHVTIGYGGAFYAYVDADRLGVRIAADNERELVNVGMAIKHAVMDQYTPKHPGGDDDLNFIYGTILVADSPNDGIHSRNVCIFADGEVDRSPTGTGVSGRVAIHHARGEIVVGEQITIESLIETSFTGKVTEMTWVNGHPAVIPEVSGTAHITGRHEFLIDPDDPLRDGFRLW